MKKTLFFIAFLLCTTIFYGQNKTVIGKWKTIDDVTGQAKSILEIYEKSGKINGKVIEILDLKHKKSLCNNCEGEYKDKPILGLVVIKGLVKKGDQYGSGKIIDPTNGNIYKCYISLVTNDKLKIRGYIGISLFGRTQYWHRVKE